MNRIIYYIFISLTLLSCKKKEIIEEEKIPFRTVLVYLAANNNLSNEAHLNIGQMKDHIGNINGNLLVYTRLPNKKTVLYHVVNKNGKGDTVRVKEYGNQNSSDPTVLRKVINEIQTNYKAKSYGLILWSHATGWVPPNVGPIKLKSFGSDNGDEMDIKDLNNALPSQLFDFIMFDACSMASVEVLYEIKDKANYFIASPGEVISNGMPYNKIVNDLFKEGSQAYMDIAKKYFDHYNSMTGDYQSATISVVDASKLQAIADASKLTLQAQSPLHADYKRDHIQRMDFDRYYNPLIAFDYLDFIETNYDNPNVNTLKSAINESLLYKANTSFFNGFKIDKNSGLTCYIPHDENENIVHDYYRTLKWYNASGFNTIF